MSLKKPKILHIVWSLKIAGAEKIAYQLLSAARDNGFEPHVCGIVPSSDEDKKVWTDADIQAYEIFKKPGIDIKLVFSLRKLIRKNMYSILHTHNGVGAFYGGFARMGLRLRHIHTEHSNIAAERKFFRFFTTLLLKSSRLIADSQKVRLTLMRREQVKPQKIQLIYNGISIDDFQRKDSKGVLSDLGIPEGSPIVGTVAHLRKVKDQATLLSAFSKIEFNSNPPHLIVVGEGPERENLTEMARELRISDRVHLVGASKSVSTYLSCFDVFALSSTSEGLPLSLLEAMSIPVPCVATSVGGIPEIIGDQMNGLLVPPKSPRALAKSIDSLLRSPDRAKAFATSGQKIIRERFSLNQMIDSYLQVYKEEISL